MGVMAASGAEASLRPATLMTAAIERLYVVFAAHPPRPDIAYCPHCTSAEDVASIASAPLPHLTAAAIDRYIPKALTTFGDAHDLRAVLPRIVELLAARRLATDPAVLFAKLSRAGWRSWPLEERAAIEDALSALWLSALATHPSEQRAWRLLTALAEATDDVKSQLDDWQLVLFSSAPEREMGLAQLLALDAAVARWDGDAAPLFWSPRPGPASQLERFLRRPAIANHRHHASELEQGD
jgi:hypothetical protein